MIHAPLNRTAARRFLGTLARPDGTPVPDRTFARWMASGLPHRKLGREAAFYKPQLEAWFNRQGKGFFQ